MSGSNVIEALAEAVQGDFARVAIPVNGVLQVWVRSRDQDLARIAELEDVLAKIASCEKRCDGDVVDLARKALGKQK